MLCKEICWKCYRHDAVPDLSEQSKVLLRQVFERDWLRHHVCCGQEKNRPIHVAVEEQPQPNCPYALEHTLQEKAHVK